MSLEDPGLSLRRDDTLESRDSLLKVLQPGRAGAHWANREGARFTEVGGGSQAGVLVGGGSAVACSLALSKRDHVGQGPSRSLLSTVNVYQGSRGGADPALASQANACLSSRGSLRV